MQEGLRAMSDNATLAASVGNAVHNGWAIFVAVCTANGMPLVVERRRKALIEPGVRGQPYYHQTLELELADAEALIRQVRTSVVETARAVLTDLQVDLAPVHEAILGSGKEFRLFFLPPQTASCAHPA